MSNITDLSIVVAMTPSGVIGRNNDLPWGRIPSDLGRFRKMTQACGVVVLGRKTHESILARIGTTLPGRHHIVLSRRAHPNQRDTNFVPTLEKALDLIAWLGGRACVIGGAEVYRLFLPLAQCLVVTTVYVDVSGDTLFPDFSVRWRHSGERLERQRWSPGDAHETSLDVYIPKDPTANGGT